MGLKLVNSINWGLKLVEVGWIKSKDAPVDWDEATIIKTNFNSKALNALFCGVTNEEFKKISSRKLPRKYGPFLRPPIKVPRQ